LFVKAKIFGAKREVKSTKISDTEGFLVVKIEVLTCAKVKRCLRNPSKA
jgi:hypothetical protein